MIFLSLVMLVAMSAGAVASVCGFGIGSLLTPLLSWELGVKVAVAAVSIPHVCGTALRCWWLRKEIHRGVLLTFGLASASGGLAGALLHTYANSPVLAVALGILLVFAGGMELTGWNRRLKATGFAAWAAGAASGLFGGLVGNQGGIRSAALLSFDLPKASFVATATAIALIVDAVRMPVYFATHWRELIAIWPHIVVATGGVLLGTVLGRRLLDWIPEPVFRKVVGVLLLALGLVMLVQALGTS